MFLEDKYIDIPPIKPELTEYQIFKKVCNFGHCNVSEFLKEVNYPISYGTNIQATITYLHTRQYLPFARMSEFFSDFCSLPISQGTICNLVNKFAQNAASAYKIIAQKLENESVVGSDETGDKINGKTVFFAFLKRMTKYKDYIFSFLHHYKIPPDNKASERVIRNVKVKQKI